MTTPIRLSKSRFVAGLQCHKQLWWKVHEPGAPELVAPPALRNRFDQGAAVGLVARQYVPGAQYARFERECLRNLAEGVPRSCRASPTPISRSTTGRRRASS